MSKNRFTWGTLLFSILGFNIFSLADTRGDASTVTNPGFEEVSPNLSESGVSAPASWQLHRWKAPDDILQCGLSMESPSEGKESAFIEVTKAGSVAWVSNSITLPANLDSLHFEVMMKKSEDYVGNTPWILITWSKKDGTYISNTPAILPAHIMMGEWNSVGLDINASDIPPDADHFQINLGTSHNDAAGDSVSGQIFYDDVKLTFTPKTSAADK